MNRDPHFPKGWWIGPAIFYGILSWAAIGALVWWLA